MVPSSPAEESSSSDDVPAGWYEDPYRRWRARYWDGQRWTERVANQGADATQPQCGTDPLVAVAEDPAFSGLVEALYASELSRLHAEADHWRLIAEDRQRALDAIQPAGDDVGGIDDDVDDPEPEVDHASAFTDVLPAAAPPNGKYVAVPPQVRDAAMAIVEGRKRTKRPRRSR